MSKNLKPNEISYLRARLDALDGGIQTFRGYDPARCRPIAYPSKIGLPDGSTGQGTVSLVYDDNKRMDLSGLVEGFVVSTGDMIQIGDADLYSIVQGAVADADGVAKGVEIRPFFWPGTVAGSTFTIMQPSCLMAVDPTSVSEDASTTSGRGTYSFTAWEVRDA